MGHNAALRGDRHLLSEVISAVNERALRGAVAVGSYPTVSESRAMITISLAGILHPENKPVKNTYPVSN